MEKIKGFLDQFDSPLQLADFMEQTPGVQEPSEQGLMNENDYKGLREGENVVIEEFQAKLDALENIQSRFVNSYNVVGSRINMSRAMTGNPKSMVYQERRQKKSRDITLIIDMTMPWRIPNGTIKKIGGKVLSALERLSIEGNKIEIYACCTGANKGYTNVMLVNLKKMDEQLELSRVSYALSNPNFLRHVFFEWHTKDERIKILNGLGCYLSSHYSTKALSEAFSVELQKKALYISFINYESIDYWSSDALYDDLSKKFDELDKSPIFN